MYGTATTATYCSFCGRGCSCASGIFQIGYHRTPEEIREAERERKMEEELRRWAALQMSLEMSRDYSPQPEPRPTVHSGVLSTAFHWMSQRKRAFKIRASKPGWDRGR
jgi:hypothetical protein